MRAFLLLIAALTWASPASAQIRVRNGGVPSPAAPQLSLEASMLEAENLSEVRTSLQLDWSPDGKTGLGINVPLVRREALDGVDEASGLGDVVLSVKRSLRQDDEVLASERWALYADLRLPTGDDRALEGPAGFLPKLLQPGMGSVGVGAGGVYTLIRDRHRVSLSLGGQWTDEVDGFQMGPEIRAGAAYWYRLSPAEFSSSSFQPEVRPVIEALFTQRFESDRDGVGTGDEGGLLWIAPGVQVYAREDLLLQASVAVPILNDIDDAIGRRDLFALVTVRWYF